MTEPDRRDKTIVAPGGRRLGFAEWGDLDGFPVFSLHGTPGGRLARHPDEAAIAAEGARVITYDRPGYGLSDRMPGRRIVDCVDDVVTIADHLGIERFSVDGGSGGGPHALAVAARLGRRVSRARCEVGIAPFGLDDLDFFDGMDPTNVTEFGWAIEGEAVLVPELERKLRYVGERVATDPAAILGGTGMPDDSDHAVIARPDMAQVIRESVEDLVKGGVWGWVDDDLAFVRPWGFELAEIAVPVEVRYASKDVLVPAAHGAWLGRNIPGAIVVVDEDQGHMGDLDDIGAMTRWLVSGV